MPTLLVDTIFERNYLEPKISDRSVRTGKYHITFSSCLEPPNKGDNPRRWRTWKGKIELKNAEFSNGKISNYRNKNLQSFNRLNQKEATFSILTRGSTSSMVLDLTNIKRNASAALTLDPVRKFGGGPPVYRTHQDIDPANIRLKFTISESHSSQNNYTLPTTDYVDQISVRPIIEDGPIDVPFELEDNGNKQGDYYYVRIKQADDAYARSSPI